MCATGMFHLAIVPRVSGNDTDMSNSQLLDMPVKFGLKLMPVICPHRLDAKGKLLENVVGEINGFSLGVLLVDLHSADRSSIVNS